MRLEAEEQPARFARLFEQTYAPIRAYAARRVGDAMADDVAAETFLVAWRRLDSMPSEPLPWLYGVAHNIVMRQYAVARRDLATRHALGHERLPQAVEDDQTDPDLWQAWERLKPRDREILALVAWEELSVPEGAQALGCSKAVFSVRLHRARRRLERLLREIHDSHLSEPSPGRANAVTDA
jgi:RNA polymerase sigma-70 factor (ECF subfamily)